MSSHQADRETLNEEQDHVLEKSGPFPREDPFPGEADPSNSENASPVTRRMWQGHRLWAPCWTGGAKEFRQAFTEEDDQVPWPRKEHLNQGNSRGTGAGFLSAWGAQRGHGDDRLGARLGEARWRKGHLCMQEGAGRCEEVA